MIAHIGALPVEEVLPVLAGAGSGLLAVRACVMSRLRRRRESREVNHFMFGPDWDAGGEGCSGGSGGGHG
jgi:hypothetical protein